MRGRWRGVGRSGEEGSFFTTILGGPPFSRRELECGRSASEASGEKKNKTYDSGELFGADCDFGLPLSVRCADMFGVADADTRPWGGGDLGADTDAISTNEARSCGAGDGAIATAVLMMPDP